MLPLTEQQALSFIGRFVPRLSAAVLKLCTMRSRIPGRARLTANLGGAAGANTAASAQLSIRSANGEQRVRCGRWQLE